MPDIDEEKMIRRMGSPAENITAGFADDYMQVNAEFRSKAGMQAYIIRDDHSGCCQWCSKQAGKYAYPDDVPQDVYRRHDNCKCTVEYVTNGRKQNVHTKQQSMISPEDRKRMAKLSEKGSVRLSPEEAAEAERKALTAMVQKSGKMLTNRDESGIVKSIDVDDYMIVVGGKEIAPEVNEVILNTMKKCEKDGGFVISEISDKITSTESEGTPVFQIEPMANGLLKLNVNTELLSGKSLDEINELFITTDRNLAQSLVEAIVHESGHAILIKGKSPAKVKQLYAELKSQGRLGISNIALKDGVECLAELEVLRYRKTKISKELSDFYEKYMGRKYL